MRCTRCKDTGEVGRLAHVPDEFAPALCTDPMQVPVKEAKAFFADNMVAEPLRTKLRGLAEKVIAVPCPTCQALVKHVARQHDTVLR